MDNKLLLCGDETPHRVWSVVLTDHSRQLGCNLDSQMRVIKTKEIDSSGHGCEAAIQGKLQEMVGKNLILKCHYLTTQVSNQGLSLLV